MFSHLLTLLIMQRSALRTYTQILELYQFNTFCKANFFIFFIDLKF